MEKRKIGGEEERMMAKEEIVNPTKVIKVGKVVINIGVGKSGEPLERAKKVLELIAEQKPCERRAKKTIRDFGIHKKEPIAVMVTLRKDKALRILKKLLTVKNMKLPSSSFDDYGNVSFGIKEHLDIPGMKYDPSLGIFGMDVSVALVRMGYRIKERKRMRRKIGKNHRVSKEEAIEFFKSLGVEVT
ncbi:50S ribosomal protein L5 [archaeon HR06]|nr:50S ribosomal protein L5 [archaeon HR06]